jgi:hypothetical protein
VRYGSPDFLEPQRKLRGTIGEWRKSAISSSWNNFEPQRTVTHE